MVKQVTHVIPLLDATAGGTVSAMIGQAQAQARMLSWKQELKTNPKAPPPSGEMPVKS